MHARIALCTGLAKDWQIGARGGDDFWVRAERFIAQRVSRQVDREFVFL
jgi:hypothetical protein